MSKELGDKEYNKLKNQFNNTYLQDKSDDHHLTFCPREFWPFGHCPIFVNYKNGIKKYWYEEKFISWVELKQDLLEKWRPTTIEDWNWFERELQG